MFKFNSQITKLKNKANMTEYTIQIATDSYEQYKFIQDMARECVDGKHKEIKNGKTDWTRAYSEDFAPDDFNKFERLPSDLKLTTSFPIAEACKTCPNHPSNGGSGNCNCTLGTPKVTC